MKVKITNKSIAWANKENQPYLDKRSRPYARVGIQTEQHGKTWLSGFAYQGSPLLSWTVGQEVEIETETKKVGDKEYLNFSIPRDNQQGSGIWTPDLVEKLFGHLQSIEAKLDALESLPPDGGIEGTDAEKDDVPQGMPF